MERVSHPTHLETIVQWAVNEGRHQIAIWGGDGTLSRAVQALYESKALKNVAIALIPVGTCNDFARKLVFPSWKKYIRLALNTPSLDRHFDVGLLSSSLGKRIFINNAGFGRNAAAINHHRRSNPIRDIFSFTTKKLDLEWEHGGAKNYETRRGLLGVVCNSPFFNRGMYFSKDIEPDDAVLNAFIEAPQSKIQLLLKFLKCRLGFPLANHSTFRIDASALRVESNEDLFPQVDGEPVGENPVRVLEYSILPNKLRLVIWR